MKKLVKLDEDFGLTEIDWKATRRQAEKVRAYIEQAPADESAKYDYKVNMMPLINGVMDGTLKIPYLEQEPYNARFIMEGQAPDLVQEFQDVFYKFMLMINASSSQFSLSTHETGKYILGKYRVEKDGELYEWCWFED
jgi:hypothetical protein